MARRFELMLQGVGGEPVVPGAASFQPLLANLARATGARYALLELGAPDGRSTSRAVWPSGGGASVLAAFTRQPPPAESEVRGPHLVPLPTPDEAPELAPLRGEGVRACLCAPLVSARGAALGRIGLLFGERGELVEAAPAILEAFGSQVVAEVARRSAEEALAREHAYFEQLLHTASDAIVILDREDRILAANRRFEETFGYAQAQLEGRRINDLIVPADALLEAEGLSRLSHAGSVVRAEGVRVDASGRPVPVSIVAYPVIIGGRQVGVIAAYRDVSDQRRATEALRASEERYRTLFESSKDVIYISTPDGRLVDINPAGVELFEYPSRQAMLALDLRELYIRPEDRERLVALLERDGFVVDFEAELRTRSGRRLIVQDSCTAARDAEGRMVTYRGFLRDVTEQRSLEQQLRHSQKMEALGRIAGGVAHDFNNLLMGIEGFASVVATELGEADPRRADVEEIRKLARLGGQLTRKLLAFSRQQVLSVETVRLNRLVEEIEGFLSRVLGEQIEQVHLLEQDLWPVRVDPSQLEQVLINLAVNARDAMPDGGTLTMRTENVVLEDPRRAEALGLRPGPWVRLSVSDTGVGMTREVQERIFEPFFTTKDVGRGSGLGLAIVYGIVSQSGGAIHVTSAPGEGSTFEIYLPRAEGEPVEPTAKVDTTLVSRGHERVLLAEDEDAVRRSLERVLERHGYEVVSAADGLGALELSRSLRGTIDVLVADVQMPRLSGTALLGELRRVRPGLPALFISGHVSEDIDDAARTAGVPVLRKPFRPESLLAALREILDGG
ncbi:MAG: hypothetical protein Kow0062_04080 [Acidobacteriota bacterium]